MFCGTSRRRTPTSARASAARDAAPSTAAASRCQISTPRSPSASPTSRAVARIVASSEPSAAAAVARSRTNVRYRRSASASDTAPAARARTVTSTAWPAPSGTATGSATQSSQSCHHWTHTPRASSDTRRASARRSGTRAYQSALKVAASKSVASTRRALTETSEPAVSSSASAPAHAKRTPRACRIIVVEAGDVSTLFPRQRGSRLCWELVRARMKIDAAATKAKFRAVDVSLLGGWEDLAEASVRL